MRNWLHDMVRFHQAIDAPIKALPEFPDEPRVRLRMDLIDEEVNDELLPAIAERDLVGVADGITDAIVVLIGAALEFGIDLRPVWAEVWRTNMAKADGPVRSDGKRLKPKGWTPPNIGQALWQGDLTDLIRADDQGTYERILACRHAFDAIKDPVEFIQAMRTVLLNR